MYLISAGREPWDAPCSLKEMLPIVPPLAETDILDFQMRLLSLRDFPEKSLPRTEKNLRTMIKYLKREDDPAALGMLLESDPDYQEVPVDTARAIAAITGTKIEIPKKQETVDMCKAQRILLKRQWDAGQADGLKRGLEDGLMKGRHEEKQHGIQAVISLARLGNLANEQVVQFLVQAYGLTPEEALAYLPSTP